MGRKDGRINRIIRRMMIVTGVVLTVLLCMKGAVWTGKNTDGAWLEGLITEQAHRGLEGIWKLNYPGASEIEEAGQKSRSPAGLLCRFAFKSLSFHKYINIEETKSVTFDEEDPAYADYMESGKFFEEHQFLLYYGGEESGAENTGQAGVMIADGSGGSGAGEWNGNQAGVAGQGNGQTQPGVTGQGNEQSQPGVTGQGNGQTQPGVTGQWNEQSQPGVTGQGNEQSQPGVAGQWNEQAQPGVTGQGNGQTQPGVTGQWNAQTQPGVAGQWNTQAQPGITGQGNTQSQSAAIDQSDSHPQSTSRQPTVTPRDGTLTCASSTIFPITGTTYRKEQLADYDFLMKHFYSVHTSTTAGRDLMKADNFLSRDFTLEGGNEKPQILIYHTHSQETFADYGPENKGATVVGMGNYLTELLTAKGYNVIHDTTVYDLHNGKLDRNKAYTYALEGIAAILQKNPSIEVVLDLHRDGVNEKLHLVNTVNGKPTAPIMFFNGVSQTPEGPIEYLPNPFREDNLAFSFQMQLDAAAYFPNLTRKIYLKGLRYNLHLRPRSALIEVGAQTNTYQEALNAMEPLAEVLDMVLQGN